MLPYLNRLGMMGTKETEFFTRIRFLLQFLIAVFFFWLMYLPAATAHGYSDYNHRQNFVLIPVEEAPPFGELSREELILGPYYDNNRTVEDLPAGGPEIVEPDADEPEIISQEGAVVPLCRFGVNVNSDNGPDISAYEINDLRLGWYINYLASANPSRPNGMEYAPVVRLLQTGPDAYTFSPSPVQLLQAVANNPGADWFMGNEPDRMHFQDGIEPHLYARAYHELYELIKGADPNAKIFAGAIVQPTQLRIRYLELILASYQEQFGQAMPVDGWAIHNFILNEASCDHYQDLNVCWGADIPPGVDAIDGLRLRVGDNDDIMLFALQIQQFRQWMKDKGYQDSALYVSEYGVLMPATFGFNATRVNEFMDQSFDYLLYARDYTTGNPSDDHRLVQRLSWYSISDIQRFNGYLFMPSSAEPTGYRRSAMGDNFVDYVSQVPAYSDIYPVRFTIDPPLAAQQSSSVTVTLEAVIANSGNKLAADSTMVRFYQGDPANGGVQIGTDQFVSLTGCGDQTTLQITLPDVTPDSQHRFYVQVDSATLIDEANRENDTVQASLLFVKDRIFLPLIQR